MSKLTDDLDPRLLILPIEAWYKDPGQRDAINGVLILSTIGIHFYGQRFDATHKKFVDIEPEHVPLPDTRSTTSAWTSTPVIQATVYRVGALSRTYNIGFTKAIGRGDLGVMFAGIGNLSKQVSTGDKRTEFMAALEEVRKRAPSFASSHEISDPFELRFRYFTKASALGPAIIFGDKALNSSPKSRAVKRIRAWLLLESQRYRQLLEESWKTADKDAEVLVVHGFVNTVYGTRDKAKKMFEQAQQLEPENVRVQAASVLSMAMQGKNVDMQIQTRVLQSVAEKDQKARLLLGSACELSGDHAKAIDHYIASASLAQGYIEGATVTGRMLSLASALNAQAGMRIMQQFTQAIPEQREAWKGLLLAAKRASDKEVAKQAQERLTAMENTVF